MAEIILVGPVWLRVLFLCLLCVYIGLTIGRRSRRG